MLRFWSPMDAAKDELRQKMRDLRLGLSPEDVRRRGAHAAPYLLALPELAQVRRVALFAPVRNEIDTMPLHHALRQRGVVVLYPRIVATDTLSFAAVASLDDMRPGQLGIPEPAAAEPEIATTAIDVFVVPGLAFGPAGERLGWGRGHYDRTLAGAPLALRVGFAYDFQVVPVVPVGADDVCMDVVVSCAGAHRIAEPHLRRAR